MSPTITATNTASDTESLFKKLDIKQKGYIDEADLKAAAGDDSAAASKSAEVLKQLDSDGNGKVTKSELSTAVEKVGRQLDAQMDQSRVKNATGGAKAGEGAGGHGGGGAPPATSSGSDTASATKYVAAADTNGDGTVSADEEAAYKKLLASAETKAQAQVQEYKNNSGDPTTSTSGSVDVSA